MREKLTAKTIVTVVPGPRDIIVRDTESPLSLKVTPTGRRVFFVDVRIKRRKRRITLGSSAEIALRVARERARSIVAEVSLGGDPTARRDRERQAVTVREFALERYLPEHVETYLSAKTADSYRLCLEKHILPAVGSRLLHDVSQDDVRQLHLRLRAKPTTANRCVELLSALLRCAEEWGVRAPGPNPCRAVLRRRYPLEKRTRYLNDLEFRKLARSLSRYDALPSVPDSFTLVVRLLITTGCRRDEIRRLRWEEVNLERGWLVLQQTKTGPKIKQIGRAAVALLAAQRAKGIPGEWVCPGPLARRGPLAVSTLEHWWRKLRDEAGIGDVRLHDLRHTFATECGTEGGTLPQIGELLGHASAGMTHRYAHVAADPARDLADRTSVRIARKLGLAQAS